MKMTVGDLQVHILELDTKGFLAGYVICKNEKENKEIRKPFHRLHGGKTDAEKVLQKVLEEMNGTDQ